MPAIGTGSGAKTWRPRCAATAACIAAYTPLRSQSLDRHTSRDCRLAWPRGVRFLTSAPLTAQLSSLAPSPRSRWCASRAPTSSSCATPLRGSTRSRRRARACTASRCPERCGRSSPRPAPSLTAASPRSATCPARCAAPSSLGPSRSGRSKARSGLFALGVLFNLALKLIRYACTCGRFDGSSGRRADLTRAFSAQPLMINATVMRAAQAAACLQSCAARRT